MTSCRFSRWRISAILDFMGPMMSSLKSPCTTSYRSSIATIALNCLVFWENCVFLHFGDKQTNEQMDSIDALSRSRCRERRLNNRATSGKLFLLFQYVSMQVLHQRLLVVTVINSYQFYTIFPKIPRDARQSRSRLFSRDVHDHQHRPCTETRPV